MNEYCFRWVCFVRLDATGPVLFAFPQFMTGLALMVLAWNIVDVRYRYRTRIAPLPLRILTFYMVVAIGCLTLATDLWRAERWFVVRGNVLTPAMWQALLAFLYLVTFLTWAWFAFLKRPTFSKRNALIYGSVLYDAILRGAPDELAVIADELRYSAESVIRYAPDLRALRGGGTCEPENSTRSRG
jgi:hypothetical protein